MEDTLTFHRLHALYAYWREHPPVHQLAAAYLGVKPKSKARGDLGELIGLFDGGVIR